MSTQIKASFDVSNWDEHQFDVRAGAGKLTRANVSKAYSGDIEGDSVTQWLMAYAEDGTATFVGLERINGTIDGRDGTLVLQHVGAFEGGAAKAELTVVSLGRELLTLGDHIIDADYVRRRRQLVMDVVDQVLAALPERTMLLFEDRRPRAERSWSGVTATAQ